MNEALKNSSDCSTVSAPVKVLMVEDDDYYYKLIDKLLASGATKFKLSRSFCLADAAKYLAIDSPDVILLDLSLPDGAGLGTLLEIQRSGTSAPIIVLTASEGQELGITSIKMGATDFFVKQKVNGDSIARCIRYAIERRKSEESRVRSMAIQDFTAALAHDLQAPMIGADRVLDVLLNEKASPLSADQSQLLLALKESNSKQLQLVQKLIEIYKYETGKDTVLRERLDLKTEIQNYLPEATKLARNKNIRIEVAIAEGLHDIDGNALAIRSLLTRLVENAVKFGFSGSAAEISAINVGPDVNLRVKNFGVTIAPEHRVRLFDHFWQGVPGESYVANTGLGLYLCQRIAAFHNGKVMCVNSSAEEGTTFLVSLPGMAS